MKARTSAETNRRIVQLIDLRRRIDDELALLASQPKPRGRRGDGPASCGTESGWFRHRRIDKTPPCPACRAARNAAERARYTRKKMRKDSA